jgi:hypothetical protein
MELLKRVRTMSSNAQGAAAADSCLMMMTTKK